MSLRSRVVRSACLLALAALALAACSGTAFAAGYQLEARTEAQAYQIRSYRGTDPSRPILLPRRRVVQSLGLNVFELFTGQDIGFESSLRIFADLGLTKGEASRIDGLRTEEADLLYANVRYRAGSFEARLGRQLYVDVMDWMSFDGLKLRYVSPFGLGAEVYGGLWVKSASILGSNVYQPDGTRDSDDIRLAAGSPIAEPAYQDIEPVVGGKLLLENVKGFSAAVGYRQAWVGGKVDIQRGLVELRYGRGQGLNIFSTIDWDLYMGVLANGKLQARYDANLFAASVELLRFTPVLSSDSIWYYFATAGRDELRVRGDFTPVGPFRFYAQVLYGIYRGNLNKFAADLGNSGTGTNGGGSLGSSMRYGQFRSAVDFTYRAGYGGRQLWLDLTGGWTDAPGHWSVDARLSAASIEDAENTLLRGMFWGAQLWSSYAFSNAARISLALEQNLNPFTKGETKLFFLFDIKAIL